MVPRLNRIFTSLVLVFLFGLSAYGETFFNPARARSPSQQKADCLDQTLNLAQTYFEGIGDLSADFTQENWNVALGEVGSKSVSSGSFKFSEPKSVRWEYFGPDPSLVVSDGEKTWIFDSANKEVQVLPGKGGGLSGGVLDFLLSGSDLKKEFGLEVEDCESPVVSLLLTPGEDSLFERAKLSINSRTGHISETEIVDPFGNRTRIKFSNVRTGQGLEASLFKFRVTKDMRVLKIP